MSSPLAPPDSALLEGDRGLREVDPQSWPSGYSASRAAEAFGHDGQVVADVAVGLFLGECRQTCSADAVLGALDRLGRLLAGASTTVRREA
ncbi:MULTISPECIES: hypothetical protein [Streptomyces]|uniref:hypothetical protein n=1 Tax=Streptomyces TaxID=1883 RepID=UPI0004908A17|nr:MULTISPECIES: hypothetical protein [unclassified Streptomyces]MYY16489.1 hypothetical protein [Streptomyces sp. SID4912]